MTDDEIMIQIQSGVAAAFEALVVRYQGMLIGYFVRNTRDVQLSEDLAQETLLKVFHQSWDYLPLGRFRGWMFRIARNLLIDTYRRRAHDALIRAVRRCSDDEDDALARLAAEFVPPEQALEQAEFSRMLKSLLEEIPVDQRETFLLHHESGLSLGEIADMMDVSTGTCKSRLRLAREKLAEKLRTRGISVRQQPP